jgi:hypothetical protein
MDETGGPCSTYVEQRRNRYKISVRKYEGKTSLGEYKRIKL